MIEQVNNVCQTTVVEDAWARGQMLAVHGVVHGLSDGILHDLQISLRNPADLASVYSNALQRLANPAVAD